MRWRVLWPRLCAPGSAQHSRPGVAEAGTEPGPSSMPGTRHLVSDTAPGAGAALARPATPATEEPDRPGHSRDVLPGAGRGQQRSASQRTSPLLHRVPSRRSPGSSPGRFRARWTGVTYRPGTTAGLMAAERGKTIAPGRSLPSSAREYAPRDVSAFPRGAQSLVGTLWEWLHRMPMPRPHIRLTSAWCTTPSSRGGRARSWQQ